MRKLLALLMVAALVGLTACQSDLELAEEEETGAFSNGYLGLTVQLPENWTVLERNASNMTVYPEDSLRVEVLEKNSFDDGNYYMDLIEYSNRENEFDEDYVRIHLFAENYSLTFPNLENYMKSCINAYAGEKEDGYYASFINTRTSIIGGEVYKRMQFLATSTKDAPAYYQEYFIRQIGDLYFTVYGQYWADSERAPDILKEMVAALEYEEREELQYISNERTESVTYHNDVFGLTVTVPPQFHEVRCDDNLAEEPGVITEMEQLQRMDYPDGGYYYDIVTIQNTESLSDMYAVQMDIYVDQYSNFQSLKQYVDAAQEAYDNGEFDTLKNRTSRTTGTLNGLEYELLTFYSPYGGYAGLGYYRKYCIRELEKGLYFVVCVQYNNDSQKSIDDANTMLKSCFSFDNESGETV